MTPSILPKSGGAIAPQPPSLTPLLTWGEGGVKSHAYVIKSWKVEFFVDNLVKVSGGFVLFWESLDFRSKENSNMTRLFSRNLTLVEKNDS